MKQMMCTCMTMLCGMCRCTDNSMMCDRNVQAHDLRES